MTHPQVRRLWCGVAAVMALAGCTQTTVTPSPSTTIVGTGPAATGSPSPAATPAGTPTPTSFTCTPEAGGAPTPCAPAEYETSRQRDALYAEAEQVYRQFFARDVQLSRTGALADPSILALTGEPFTSQYAALRTKQHSLAISSVGGEYRLAYIKRAAQGATTDLKLGLSTCVDASTVSGVQNGKQLGPGGVVAGTTILIKSGGSFKIIGQDSHEVEKC